jgi:hypothetical protein
MAEVLSWFTFIGGNYAKQIRHASFIFIGVPHHRHHHSHLAIIHLDHLLNSSSFTHPEVSEKVSPASFLGGLKLKFDA